MRCESRVSDNFSWTKREKKPPECPINHHSPELAMFYSSCILAEVAGKNSLQESLTYAVDLIKMFYINLDRIFLFTVFVFMEVR